MTKYEELVIKAEINGINVLEVDLGTHKECGKYLHLTNGDFIIINLNISNAQKYQVLSEEIGHYCTTFGNILELDDLKNIKQEKRARNWGYEKTVGLIDLINAFEKGLRTKSEISEYLNVTEKFLEQAIQHYREKYGVYCEVDHYAIYFEPTLSILKML
ncbi:MULTISPECIES: ImmA/IrrE family metallo-endopeptidase [Clostridium]|uniref:ImmA/IrrE family metallo-endopeptidase n=1 Tax=Clostridium TaxID=1485 RepID=UPI0008267A36|nr:MULTISPECIES: ImmA/IrrE family metallo-endopeptidase [Clostridium]PJI07059.1 ImmA/IrrE family metallo-endopeptidase [Clostridium sp. CT7]